MPRLAGGILHLLGIFRETCEIGTLVHVRDSSSNPLSGHTGTIIDICPRDPYGPYLVEFENGLRFRYHEKDFSISQSS